VSFSPSPGRQFRPGSRWRVLPAPNDRLPGTFDQDVYVELLRRYRDAGFPADGTIAFTLHAVLRAMGRMVDGRTYEQLRGALARLERTVLESTGTYYAAAPIGRYLDERFTLLTAVSIDRRRSADREQLALFPTLSSTEPGEARVTLSPLVRANLAAGYTTTLSSARYLELSSPTARRLYRLLAAVRASVGASAGDQRQGGPWHAPAEDVADPAGAVAEWQGESGGEPMSGTVDGAADGTADGVAWDVALDALADQLPLTQRYPSHLLRVLEPAHAMLEACGLVRSATIRQQRRAWVVHYELP